MSENKLFEKTKEVFYKQKELTDLIDDLKDEVKKVYYENQKLLDENKLLKEQLALFDSQNVDKKVEEYNEPIPEPVVEMPNRVPLDVQDIEEQEEPVVNYFEDEAVKELRKNAIAEFFLGKNVIAKIAAILISLGVLTFGQMAYVDWLDDVGRTLLILFAGLVFGGIALFTEHKRYLVFSNVFYGISLFIIFYSIILGGFIFGLYAELAIASMFLVLLLATMVYFRHKNNDFLDSILYSFYLVVGFAFLYCLEGLNAGLSVVFAALFVGLIGYITYFFNAKQYKYNEVISFIFQLVHLAGMLYFLLFIILNDELLETHTTSMLLYGILQIVILYIINVFHEFDDRSKLYYVSPILIIVGMFFASIDLNMVVFSRTDASFSTVILFFSILLIPLAVLMYRKFHEYIPNIPKFYIYSSGIGYLIYGLVAQNPTTFYELTVFSRILILGSGLYASYLVVTLLKDKDLRPLYWLNVLVFSMFVAVELLINNSRFNELLLEALIFGLISLGLIGITIGIKYWKQLEDPKDKEVSKLFMVFAFIPFLIIFMNSNVSDDSAYIMAVIMLWFVGNRWLAELKPLKTELHKFYVLIMNVLIVLFTFMLNLLYFDHDFTVFADVFKLLFMLIVNIYIVYSLKEIYVDHLKEKHQEGMFVLVYLIGVLVHSYYIHNYINIEFDKVILSSYFLIASAVGVLIGFRQNWSASRRLGLFSIYFSLLKFFIYDFYSQNLDSFVRMMTYFILGFVLLGISILYAYLERTYSNNQ